MTYATRQDLVDRFGSGEIDMLDDPDDATDRVAAVLADTAAEIDSVLAERYALPLPAGRTWPALRSIACDIARAKLYDDGAPDRVLGRLSSARARLRELGDGGRTLVDATGASVALTAPSAYGDRVGPEPVMTAENFAGL